MIRQMAPRGPEESLLGYKRRYRDVSERCEPDEAVRSWTTLGPGASKTDDAEDVETIRDRINELEGIRQARLEALSANRAALRAAPSRRHYAGWAHSPLFREQGITIASILTAIGMAISTLVRAHRWCVCGGVGGEPGVPSPVPKPSDKGGLKEWVKKHLQALGRALANLASPVSSARSSIIGSWGHWGKNCGLACRESVGRGHCCGDPVSRGC